MKRGYEPKTVRLPYRLDEPEDAPMLSAACLRLQDEMLEWSSGHKRDPDRFDGTLLSLSRRYQTDEASLFHSNMKYDTRRTDLSTLRLIEKVFGQRALAHLKNEDFRRWYNEAKKPKDPGGPERIRRAYGIIKKLRELFAYGIMDALPDCQRLHTVLSQARFSHQSVHQQTLCIEEEMALLALDLLARIIAGRVDRAPPFSALLTLWLSMIAAVGLASRPACSRQRT